MAQKGEKKGLLRRGCGRLARIFCQYVMPCCTGCSRSRRDSAREHDVAVSSAMPICLRDDEPHTTLIEIHDATQGAAFSPSITILCYYICSTRVATNYFE